ncbi:ALG13 [Candida pseudojiufengensis]|uniref:ALG13 n=1 Tax=Candida pseudojiufengensis TaxID=497109 RepID=UPI00222582C9|nr:ALG13 [Candida pseudojiufengensis]KAI5961237.1 ALG13 [Candida pseudojiufengensis]
MSTLLITTGATVTFTSLIEKVVDAKFINYLIEANISRLYLQYGNEIKNSKHISKIFFESQLKESSIIDHLNLKKVEDTKTNAITLSNSKIEIVAFPFSTNIESYIESSTLVISHAGTGSIIDTLKYKKPLIVIVNNKLMDNHQLEIAEEFEKLNYCLNLNVNDLVSEKFKILLSDIINGKVHFNEFKESDGSILETIIAEELQD